MCAPTVCEIEERIFFHTGSFLWKFPLTDAGDEVFKLILFLVPVFSFIPGDDVKMLWWKMKRFIFSWSIIKYDLKAFRLHQTSKLQHQALVQVNGKYFTCILWTAKTLNSIKRVNKLKSTFPVSWGQNKSVLPLWKSFCLLWSCLFACFALLKLAYKFKCEKQGKLSEFIAGKA